ncbi:unnamed protein product [Symbiodinium sp. CCMP2592]|nr:unnamed protein product [Symbiodinium sp. CCMP2592]
MREKWAKQAGSFWLRALVPPPKIMLPPSRHKSYGAMRRPSGLEVDRLMQHALLHLFALSFARWVLATLHLQCGLRGTPGALTVLFRAMSVNFLDGQMLIGVGVAERLGLWVRGGHVYDPAQIRAVTVLLGPVGSDAETPPEMLLAKGMMGISTQMWTNEILVPKKCAKLQKAWGLQVAMISDTSRGCKGASATWVSRKEVLQDGQAVKHAPTNMRFGTKALGGAFLLVVLFVDLWTVCILSIRFAHAGLVIHMLAHFKTKKLRVAMHLRRGDLHIGTNRGMPDEMYHRIMNTVRSIAGDDVEIHVFSSTEKNYKPASFKSYRNRGAEVHLDGNEVDDWAHMMQADVLLLSPSSFAWVPGVFNPNCAALLASKESWA